MRRLMLVSTLVLLLASSSVFAGQAAPAAAASPSDYILLTIFLKHDQSKTLDEINDQLDKAGFYAEFPPEGIQVESWYVMMGIGQVVTLRVPPARLREVNRAIERTAWKSYRTEFYATYDLKSVSLARHEQALKAKKK